MLAVEVNPVHLELEIKQLISTVAVPESLSDEFRERRNPLEESFENRCEVEQAAVDYISQLGLPFLKKLDSFVFNNVYLEMKFHFQKVKSQKSRIPVSLAMLYAVSQNKKVVLVYKNEAKAKKYINTIQGLSAETKKKIHFSAQSSMIINDKRALTKNYGVYVFALPRLLNLLNHKSLKMQTTSQIIFVDICKVLESQAQDFSSFVNIHRFEGKETKLGFISSEKHETVATSLQDSFPTLTSFVNVIPQRRVC